MIGSGVCDLVADDGAALSICREVDVVAWTKTIVRELPDASLWGRRRVAA